VIYLFKGILPAFRDEPLSFIAHLSSRHVGPSTPARQRFPARHIFVSPALRMTAFLSVRDFHEDILSDSTAS
jgi:hypothetical protein